MTEPSVEKEIGADVVDIHAPIAREYERPQEGREPLPVLLVMAFAALLMWGGYYLGQFSEDFDRDAFELGARNAAPVAAAPRDPAVVGERTYNLCVACHQADGQGVPGTFPPLAGSEWVLGDAETTVRILLHGLEGPIEVAGQPFNRVMPAWAQLDDFELAAVATHVRSSFGNDADAVEPELVQAVREATADRSGPWSAEELIELQDAAPPEPDELAEEPTEVDEEAADSDAGGAATEERP